jgi:DMSO/TMAO reductase YedYZ molybdopterin-dependent catalytic subunit
VRYRYERTEDDGHRVARVQRQGKAQGAQCRAAAGPVPGRGLPGPVGGTDTEHRPGGLGVTITNETGERQRWNWEGFRALPSEPVTVDIHCVPHWSKLGTTWEGVPLDTLLADVDTSASFALAESYGGYSTNLPLEDLLDGKAWIAFGYDGQDLEAEHGGPARLLVPHLYLWKSAKWVRGIRLLDQDEPGFWESLGYHNYGDPWQEQRYWGD